MDFSLFLFIGLILSLLLASRPSVVVRVLLSAFWLIVFCWSLALFHPFVFTAHAWSSWLDISFSWHIDGLSRLFIALISGIGILIFVYASIYAQGYPHKQAKLLGLLQVFAISMLTIVLTDNTIVLFLGWELTTVTSYLLIQFDVADKAANQAAFNGMFISVLGGLAMLAGFILLHAQADTWSIQASLKQLASAGHLQPAFYLLLLGAITKSAQFPFYFWLPGAMKAPTPVSAYLHSATMVNAGIYLLARFHPLFQHLSVWYPTLTFFGLATMTISGILSLFQRDLKAILAYTTLFALGSMVYLLASNAWYAAQAFALFLLFHGIYKAAAFMWVGILDKHYGSRDIIKLRGLGKRCLPASIIALISLSAMAGLPPFFGFAVKEMLYEAKLASGSVSYPLMALGLISSMMIAAASIKCLFYWFTGTSQVDKVKQLKFAYVPALILALILLIMDVVEPYLARLLTDCATTIIGYASVYTNHASTHSTLLSLVTVVGGVIIFMMSQRLTGCSCFWPARLNPLVMFERGIAQFLYYGRWFTYITQRQAITKQLVLMFLALIVWLLASIYSVHSMLPELQINFGSWYMMSLSVLLILTGLSLLLSKRFLINMISFAVLGLVMSAFFVLQGAPDVAMTQLLVEILTVIILVIALRKARFRSVQSTLIQKMIHAAIAIIIGALVAWLMFLVTSVPFDGHLSHYFIQHSLPLAHGRNVVNVILVDFRAFDTFGEALVILATAIAVWLLIDQSLSKKALTQGER